MADTATLERPDVEASEDQAAQCELTELLLLPVMGPRAAVLRRCLKPAAFEMYFRCEPVIDHPGNRRLICARHEELLRDRPDLGQCSAGHRSIIIAVLPLGGGS